MPESHRCPRGEDLVYIAHACTTGNFSHVLNGILRLAYLSPAGIDVVEWIISKRPEGQGHWPPSYDVVQEHFSEIDWPNLPDDISGLDPRFAVRDILYSEKTATCTETTARLHALMKSDFVDDNFPHLIREVDDRVRLIKSLGSPTPQARRLAENPDDTFGEIVGERGDQRFARFSMYFPEVNELLRPFEEGLHVRFARPKNCKSWLEEADALHWGVHKSEPTILADQENSRNSIQTRIACLHAGLSYATVRGIRLKKVEGTPLTPHEKEVYSRLYDAVVDIAENSNLVIYGKEQINIDTGRMSLDEILAEARDIGAAAIFIEQIHKLDVQGLGRNATETTRIHRVVQRLADSPFLSVVTTQEKRMQEKRTARRSTRGGHRTRYKVRSQDAARRTTTGTALRRSLRSPAEALHRALS